MGSIEHIPTAQRWQFGLRDLFAAIGWASVVLFVIGRLQANAGGNSYSAVLFVLFATWPTFVVAATLVATRHRVLPEALIFFSTWVVLQAFLFGVGPTNIPFNEAIEPHLLFGTVWAATFIGLAARARGDRLIGITAMAAMAIWWLLVLTAGVFGFGLPFVSFILTVGILGLIFLQERRYRRPQAETRDRYDLPR